MKIILLLCAMSIPCCAQFAIQVESTTDHKAAKQATRRINDKNTYLVKANIKNGTWYRVRVGRFKTQKEAESYAQRLLAQNKIRQYFITEDSNPPLRTSVAPSKQVPTPTPPPSLSTAPIPPVLPLIATTKFKNEQVRFDYPSDWIMLEHRKSDLFIFSPDKTAFISVSEHAAPLASLTSETVNQLLNALSPNVTISTQVITLDGQQATTDFTLPYEGQIYRGILILQIRQTVLTEVTVIGPGEKGIPAHHIVLSSFEIN